MFSKTKLCQSTKHNIRSKLTLGLQILFITYVFGCYHRLRAVLLHVDTHGMYFRRSC